jgi:ABC-type Fe3+-hydroxamate transport system substrate-binding protein
LVPSITETLCYIGLSDQIIGVTKFCIHPSDIKKKSKVVGGTKNPNIAKILALQPDLIIANKEENRKEDIDVLRQHFQVYTSDIKTSIDHLRFVSDLQSIFPNADSHYLIDRLKMILPYQAASQIRSCYLIWKDPWMSIGNDTFIHHMMEKYGFENVFGNFQRYPILSVVDIKAISPEVIFLSSEPFPFKEKHIADLQKEYPEIHFRLVDGELFSWYGPKMLEAHDYLINLYASLVKR